MSGDHNQYQHDATPEEEEAWLLLEKSQEDIRKRDLSQAAWLYAASFVREHAELLSKMTIREAVEAAYKAGHNEATRSNP
jgi:hypothetical protein